MIRRIDRRTAFGERGAIVATCDTCGAKVGGDYSTREAAQAAMDAHECEAAS